MDTHLTASLHELVYTMDRFADRVLARRFGIDRNLFAFLAPLAAGSMDVTRLAESLNLTKAAISKRVPLLEQEGWLTTSADPDHRRRVVVTLTPRARLLVTEAGELLNDRFAALLHQTRIDPERLHRQVRELIDATRALETEPELP
ncbi:MAG: MarR family transcriptional regulator [Actinobacteria bacterium]|nr:MarR family transcriptional regulator [Actinomycetota bacterium]